MTQSLARLLAFPFVLMLIFLFAEGGFELTGWRTIAVLLCLISLALLYVWQDGINRWWWRRKRPALPRPLVSWLDHNSRYWQKLTDQQREDFSRKISTFIKVNEFTLKADRDYQLQEDIKCLIAHEFVRVASRDADFLYDGIDQYVVYPHPFGTPEIEELHTLEIHREDGVIIMSREQLINGFLHPATYVNVALLGAVLSYVLLHPRQNYPEVTSLDKTDIAEAHGIKLEVLESALGGIGLDKLPLLIFCFFLYPDKTKEWDQDRYQQLSAIFKS